MGNNPARHQCPAGPEGCGAEAGYGLLIVIDGLAPS